MCHRLCVTFSLKELQALIQVKPSQTARGPNYVELGTKLQPIQTYNAPSSSPCPVLLSEKHIYDGIPSSSVVLAVMQWGLMPSWTVEGKAQLKYRLTQIKKENLLRTKTLEALMRNGRRCVLVCEGFYQFVNLGNRLGKQVYFLHRSNQIDPRIKREIIQPCYIAALFDILKQSDQRDLYSFAIITVDTPAHLAGKLNARLPAILNKNEDILDWLDFARVSADDALPLLEHSVNQLQIDRVSGRVLKRSNNGPECISVVPEGLVKEQSLSPSPSALIDSEEDVDARIVENQLEDIEKQHGKQIQHFIEEEEKKPSRKAMPPLSHPPIDSDPKDEENALRNTLEALSDRATRKHHGSTFTTATSLDVTPKVQQK